MAADGQVTLGSEVLKANAKKLRRLYKREDCGWLCRIDSRRVFAVRAIRSQAGAIQRESAASRVELAKDWRTDKILRHLEALLLVADAKNTFILSGNGDVIDPDEEVAAIGSGGPFALSAATALMHHTKLTRNRSRTKR